MVGRINRENGIWIEINTELFQTIEVFKEINQEFNLPYFLGNDVYCETLSKNAYGVGKKTDNYIYEYWYKDYSWICNK